VFPAPDQPLAGCAARLIRKAEAAIIRGDGRERLGVRDVTDEVFVRRVARSGDERAISELYDRYARLIYGAGVRYLGNRALAEDLVQDVFTAVFARPGLILRHRMVYNRRARTTRR
jgi:RNA polymerase sigma-70 factor, ECF subfamily